MEKTKIIVYVAAILGGLSFGNIPIFSATLRDLGASSFEQSIMRLFFGAIVGILIILFLLPFRSKMIKDSLRFSGQRGYMLQGFILAIMVILYLSSIAIGTPAGEAALLIQVHPFITLILGWILFREKITIAKIVALIFATTGLVLLVHPWDVDSFLSSAVGDALAILMGILYAGYIMVSRWNNKNTEGISPIISVSWILIWTCLMGIPFLLILRLFNLPTIIIGFSFENIFLPKILLNGILLAVIGGLVPYGFIAIASKYLEASKSSILLLSEPIGAMVLAYLFLQEPITLWYILGGSAIICAVVLTIIAQNKEEVILKEIPEKNLKT